LDWSSVHRLIRLAPSKLRCLCCHMTIIF
jgi:hypothetical protein